MTIIRVCKLNVIYFMCITGYNYLSMYNDTIANNNNNFELEEVRILSQINRAPF